MMWTEKTCLRRSKAGHIRSTEMNFYMGCSEKVCTSEDYAGRLVCAYECVGYLSRRASVHSSGHWVGRFERTRPSAAVHPYKSSALWNQRWICPHSAPHWEEIQDVHSPPLWTHTESSSEYNYSIITVQRLQTKFALGLITVRSWFHNKWAANIASSENAAIIRLWKPLSLSPKQLLLHLAIMQLKTKI